MKFEGLVREYLDRKGKTCSLYELASKCQVSYSALRRAIQRESKASIQTMLSVLPIISTSDQMATCLETEYPESGKFFRDLLVHRSDSPIEEVVRPFLTDYETFVILHLAVTGGVDQKSIERLLGVPALNKLDNLLDQEVLKLENGKYVGKNFSVQDLTTLKIQVIHAVNSMREQHIEQGKFHLSFFSDGVDETGESEICKELGSAEIRIARIKKEHPGNRRIFTSLILGSLGEVTV